VLQSADRLWGERGVRGASLDDIAREASVTKPTVYYYFSDKTELFIELGTETYRQVLEGAEAFGELGHPPSHHELEAWVERYVHYLDRYGAFVIRSADDMPTDRKFRGAVARSHRRTAAALGEGIAKVAATPPDVEAAATGLDRRALPRHRSKAHRRRQ